VEKQRVLLSLRKWLLMRGVDGGCLSQSSFAFLDSSSFLTSSLQAIALEKARIVLSDASCLDLVPLSHIHNSAF